MAPLIVFKKRVNRWAAKIGVHPERIYVQAMRNKWASCSTAGRIYFSKDILRTSPAFQDAVIAHELIHLLVPNHGALFTSYLNAYLPQKRRTAELRCLRRFGTTTATTQH